MNPNKRLSLPLSLWPAADQAAWRAAFTAGDIFDDSGFGLRLSATSRRNLFFGYGRWLGFLMRLSPESLNLPPLSRVTPTSLAGFVSELSDGRKPMTIYNGMRNLISALRIMFSGADLAWTKPIVQKLKRRVSRPHTPINLDSAELFTFGLALMEGNKPKVRTSPRARQIFRDGLVIAFLAARPLRRRSLAALAIGKTLRKVGDTWMVILGREDVKTREPLEFPFPDALLPALEFYLTEVRPRFPGADCHNGLWATSFDTAMSGDALHETVTKRTRVGLGRAVALHDFRRAAATTIAVHQPDSIGAAQHLLGHRHPSTTRDHYILASNLQAAKAHQEALAALRERTYPRKRRAKT